MTKYVYFGHGAPREIKYQLIYSSNYSPLNHHVSGKTQTILNRSWQQALHKQHSEKFLNFHIIVINDN